MDHTLSRRQLVQGAGVVGLGLMAGCGSSSVSGRQPPQPPQRAGLPRIGYLGAGASTMISAPITRAFVEGLRDHGYIEGENIAIEYRFADWEIAKLPDLAAELVHLPVDVLVAADSQTIPIAKQATSTIPIVMPIGGDVVGQGLAASIRRPGGNLTGLTNLSYVLDGKRLELLTETLPDLSRVGVLWNATSTGLVLQWQATRDAAARLGVEPRSLEVRSRDEVEGALGMAVTEQVQALLVLPDPLTSATVQRIASRAMESRLPTIGGTRDFVEAGGLMAYGTDRLAMYRRAAAYVDRILKGANPAELPIEQPTRFELIVNLKTAQALGLTIPREVLLDAVAVIQ